jgi:hypothetical protein
VSAAHQPWLCRPAWASCPEKCCSITIIVVIRQAQLPLPVHPCRFPGAEFKSFASQQGAEQYLHSMSSSNQGTAAAAAAGPSSSLAGSKRPFSDMDSRPPPPAFCEASQLPPAAAAAAAAAGPGVVGVPQQQQGELQVTIFFDGGSRGNPGVAGYGYSIEDRQTGFHVGGGAHEDTAGGVGGWGTGEGSGAHEMARQGQLSRPHLKGQDLTHHTIPQRTAQRLRDTHAKVWAARALLLR